MEELKAVPAGHLQKARGGITGRASDTAVKPGIPSDRGGALAGGQVISRKRKVPLEERVLASRPTVPVTAAPGRPTALRWRKDQGGDGLLRAACNELLYGRHSWSLGADDDPCVGHRSMPGTTGWTPVATNELLHGGQSQIRAAAGQGEERSLESRRAPRDLPFSSRRLRWSAAAARARRAITGSGLRACNELAQHAPVAQRFGVQ